MPPVRKYDAQCVPFWDNGDTLTAIVDESPDGVVGKRFLSCTGRAADGQPIVALADGTTPVFGVSAFSSPHNDRVTVHHQPAIIVPVTSGGVLAAGDPVVSDAVGRAVVAGEGVAAEGITLDPAAGAGVDVAIDRSVRAVGA